MNYQPLIEYVAKRAWKFYRLEKDKCLSPEELALKRYNEYRIREFVRQQGRFR